MDAKAYPKLSHACQEAGAPFPQRLIESHPRIAERIEATWGTREGTTELTNLVFSDRPNRAGFSFDVMRELFMLKELHEATYPHLSISPDDPFSSTVAEVTRADIERRREGSKGPGGSPADRWPIQAMDLSPKVSLSAAQSSTAVKAIAEKVSEKPEPPAVSPPWPMIASLNELRTLVERRKKGERLPQRDKRRILEILRHYMMLREEDIEIALKIQKQLSKKGMPIGKILLSMGFVKPETIVRVLCLQYGVLMVDLKRFQSVPEVMQKVPIDVARKHRAVPIAFLGGTLFLAVENPFEFAEREYFAFLTKAKIELVMATAAQISQWLADYGVVRSMHQGTQEFDALAQRALGKSMENVEEASKEEVEEAASDDSQNDASIVSLVNKFINDAAEVGASDIHLECFPMEPLARIRFRRDGRLEDYSQYSASY
ncbi:MAG: hypothetical protein N2441_03695, partial [Rhodocyclaceae bacterium]|nr:hypothetical protein [Rhodocyclaceae bacterium]